MTRSLIALAFVLLGSGLLSAQGVSLARGARALSGSAANCTKPATIDFEAVRDATPEWQEIEGEGVREGSARFRLLNARMSQRIKAALAGVVADTGHDLVAREGEIADPRGLDVEDITDDVIDALGSVEPDPFP